LGRSVILVPSADAPRYAALRGLERWPRAARRRLWRGECAGPWTGPRAGGLCACTATRARRLARDDCARLGGLLCDLIGVDRWEVSARAIARDLRGRYDLTGHTRRDGRLSAILNRAWAGDAGGALARVAGRRGGYTNPRKLLADVVAAW